MKKVSGHYATCPICGTLQDVEPAESGKATIASHRDPKSDAFCQGSRLPIPDRLVKVARV